MIIVFLILIIAVIAVVFTISLYNQLVKNRTMMEEGWSGIDVQLKKRHDLIPNLLETVKAYAAHEEGTLLKVIEARQSALKANNVADQQAAENQLQGALNGVFALAEAYPDLRSNENFKEFQKELADIEDDIDKSRRYYNATVRENNIKVESFPGNVIANSFGFKLGKYFELESAAERATPKVKF